MTIFDAQTFVFTLFPVPSALPQVRQDLRQFIDDDVIVRQSCRRLVYTTASASTSTVEGNLRPGTMLPRLAAWLSGKKCRYLTGELSLIYA